jgi:hypothetical protein
MLVSRFEYHVPGPEDQVAVEDDNSYSLDFRTEIKHQRCDLIVAQESRIERKHQRCVLIVALESSLTNQHQRCALIVDQDFRSKSYRISTKHPD